MKYQAFIGVILKFVG